MDAEEVAVCRARLLLHLKHVKSTNSGLQVIFRVQLRRSIVLVLCTALGSRYGWVPLAVHWLLIELYLLDR